MSGGERRGAPTVVQLRAFLGIAEHLHFRDAAAGLGMSQPALSGAIAALEENLGTRLVERTTRRVLLTPDGERLVGRARRVVDAMDDLVAAAREPFTGPLRLGVIPTVAPYTLPAALRVLRREHPGLELFVHEEQTAQALDGLGDGRLDLLLLALPAARAGMVELPLFEEDFVLLVPEAHALAGRRTVRAEEVPEEELLLLDEGHCLRDQALEVCRGRAAATRAAGLPTLVQLVAAGLGVTLLPRTSVEVETGKGTGLRTVEFAGPRPSRTIGLVLRQGTPRSQEFHTLAQSIRTALPTLPVRPTP
ncbi:DNA-binding transcriptional regulator OxyR [Mangrovactinospora gilvigrisea]|uniref:Probable hydrogen peroxide-inducible genes activator n=1 Tax=Mangrovactinospora gilvigrisea TaxID=1428644 RepID=A0A1J7C6G4_9ACTN|nr:LysR substrate-binding domain-containing protein [Mangrovactinospora gilvigrisea]OIV37132.1 DNA-binding transcriptional regulator OxyR [Mangrovactinospora gilvigrisea]